MTMLKQGAAVILVMLLCLALAACGGGGAAQSTLSEEEYLPPIIPPLDKAITDRLSAAQVSEIMGVEMTASEEYEHGTWVQYLSADGSRMVSVNMENTTVALYEAMLAELSGGEAATIVGERAYWYPASGEIIAYHDGYVIGVSVTDPTVVSTKGLCEAVTLKIIRNLENEK